MKVKELINQLSELNQDYEVVMSKDGEGNSFSPFADIGLFMYIPDSTWSGEIKSKEDCDYNGVDYVENAVCLWPTN